VAFDDDSIKLNVDGSQAIAALDAAGKAAEQFGKMVESGAKGAERAAALLTIQIDKLEQEVAQLKAQGKPTAQFEAGLATLKEKLAASTAQLGKYKAAAADVADATRKATQRAGEFSGSVTDVTGTLKTLSPALGNAIDKYSILAAKAFVAVKAMQVAAEGAKELAKATGDYNGATKEAIDSASGFASALASFDFAGAIRNAGQFLGTMHDLTQGISQTTVALGEMANAADAKAFAGLLKVQRDLVAGHEAEVAALERKSEAIVREVATQREAGEVQGWLKDQIQQTLEAYEKAHEAVDPALQAVADSLGIVTKAQEKTTESSVKLEESGVKSAEARAAAEKKAADEIVAALERERAALDAKLAQDEARLKTALGKGSKLDTSEDTSAVEGKLSDLKKKIKDIESQDLISPEQFGQLGELKDEAADLTRTMGDLNNVFTVGAEDFLDQGQAADAAAAAWDVYRDRLDKAANRQEDAMRSMEDSEESFESFTETADDAAGSLEDVADAAGDIGNAAEKGAKKAEEGLDSLKAGAEEVVPLLETIKQLLAEIKQAAAEVDL
jgi:predicted phage tail protein